MKIYIHRTDIKKRLQLIFIGLTLLLSLPVAAQNTAISGRVIDERGNPLPGVTVMVKGSSLGTTTNGQGTFTLTGTDRGSVLIVSSIGYETKQVALKNGKPLTISLTKKTNELDETIIRAYGTTTRRLNTGDISKVTAEEIERQPVSNPLAALEGRVPGLIVTQNNGIPGSAFNVQIRGRNSIAQGSEPLFVIDGVPYAPNNSPINGINSAVGVTGLSPFNNINPADIASIEILKDADATAIYGSRGGNGVILITTKKGEAGKTKLNVNIYTGVNSVPRTVPMLNTEQYLKMRHEAFANDKIDPTIYNAPDLLVWDTSRYTDFEKLLIGNTAHVTDAEVSLSGGDTTTQYLVSGGYHHQTTVFPGDLSDNRGSFHFNINHHSNNQKLALSLSGNYSSEKNNIIGLDLTNYINLPPDYPSLKDSSGNPNWSEGGLTFYMNPLAYLKEKYVANTDNLLGNMQLSYEILPDLNFNISAGYNMLKVDETSIIPKIAQNPAYNPSGITDFGNNLFKSWIIEPQVNFYRTVGNGKLSILIGATWQQTVNSSNVISASGYKSDALLYSLSGASSVNVTSSDYSLYRYQAIFSRINYNWKDRYLINLSGRRDGSSRFGPSRQFANFGAVGAAWIFSSMPFMKNLLQFVNYGKLRASYGTTGNDQIGDYQYLNLWNATPFPYMGAAGLYPSRLYNPNYGWEINRKLETALELGLLGDRILLAVAYFRNRSSNQLIQTTLPTQTGFTNVIQNLPALVQNTGVEITISTKNIKRKSFEWSSSFNISLPKNRLISFPNLPISSYANTYVIGQPLNVLNMFESAGVSPDNGVYQVNDLNKDGQYTSADYAVVGNLDPTYEGGLVNEINYKEFDFSVFFQFTKQLGKTYKASFAYLIPGMQDNQPSIVLNRWHHKGDLANIQKFTTSAYGSAAGSAMQLYNYSDGIYGNASYIRLKNLSFAYNMPKYLLRNLSTVEDINIYVRGQNLWTLTNYKVGDPETQNIYALPPLKSWTVGIRLTF